MQSAHAEGGAARGILTSAWEWLFGTRIKRLREQASRTHWLSYLLIISQSIAVILVFGHAEVGLLLTRNLAEMIGAALALFVLTITVIAADIALLDTLTRIAPLARNRQSVMLLEHLAYIAFVMAVEGSTYGIVLYTLDSNPQALVRPAPLIPTSGLAFLALVLMRVALICWSAVQLIIVREALPVLLSTLMNVGKEIVGAHVEKQLTELDLTGISVRDTFGVYAEMAQAPRPTRGLLNGWLVDRALAREAEEARQAANISAALGKLNGHRVAVGATVTALPERTPPPDGGNNGNGGHGSSRLNNAARRAAAAHDMLTAKSYMLDDEDIGGESAWNGDAEDFDMDWDDEPVAGRPAHVTTPRGSRGAQAATIATGAQSKTVKTRAKGGSIWTDGRNSREAQAVFRYLDMHYDPSITTQDIIDGMKASGTPVGKTTVKRWAPVWAAENDAAARFTQEIPAVTA